MVPSGSRSLVLSPLVSDHLYPRCLRLNKPLISSGSHFYSFSFKLSISSWDKLVISLLKKAVSVFPILVPFLFSSIKKFTPLVTKCCIHPRSVPGTIFDCGHYFCLFCYRFTCFLQYFWCIF
jgi:hypothetical protein